MKHTLRIAMLVAAPVLGGMLLAPPAAPQPDTLLHTGMCATVEVPGILWLPDGTIHEVPRARLCFDRWLTPVTGIHTLYVDRRPWGMLISHMAKDENAVGQDPLVVFERDSSGRVRLLGYAWPDRHSMLTMAFGQPGTSPDAPLLSDDPQPDERILIAALRE